MTEPTTHTLTIERELPDSQDKVWRALTEGPLLEQWLMPNDFRPIPGHRFQFRSTPMPNWDGLIHCEVLTLEPPSKLSYTWSTLGLDSVVTWTLTPTASGTILRMDHSGFPSTDSMSYKGATYGWQNFLGKLDQLLGGLE
jgi:uncharacterized protein YndB with AHSA1/START domain